MTGEKKDLARGIEWLFTDTAYLAKAQVDIPHPDPTERLILLGKLVYAVGRLHKLGWVFGDISGKNAVWALRPPRVLLLDCDGAAPLSDQAGSRGSTPTWEPPEFGAPAARTAEARSANRGHRCVQARPGDPACADPDHPGQATRAGSLSARRLDVAGAVLTYARRRSRPGVRPTAKELYSHLQRFVAASALPPR